VGSPALVLGSGDVFRFVFVEVNWRGCTDLPASYKVITVCGVLAPVSVAAFWYPGMRIQRSGIVACYLLELGLAGAIQTENPHSAGEGTSCGNI
jgi:hypothetical protein